MSVFKLTFYLFGSFFKGLAFFINPSASSISFFRVFVLNEKKITCDFDASPKYMHNNKVDYPYILVQNIQCLKILLNDSLLFDTQDIQYFSFFAKFYMSNSDKISYKPISYQSINLFY